MRAYNFWGALHIQHSFILPALVAALIFTACSDYDNGFTENQIRYEQAFLNVFGDIDPNQDWNLVKQLREKGTRAHNANSNMWGSENYDVPMPPAAFTENQRNIVRLYFQNNKFPQGEAFPFSEFFAQQIYYGTEKIDAGTAADCPEKYRNANGDEVKADMNHLLVNGEHINNFNGGCDKNTIMYMYDLNGELHFTYLNSQNSEAEHENFVIISGETIDAWAQEHLDIIHKAQRSESDWQQVEYESVAGRWFVGFDFEFATDGSIYDGGYLDFSYNGKDYHLPYLASNTNFYGGPNVEINESNQLAFFSTWTEGQMNQYAGMMQQVANYVEQGYLPVRNSNKWVIPSSCADHYYSDWIISITPGTCTMEGALLVAEDLGSQDFDFNDIVLMLEHKRRKSGSSTDQLVITAMAAGGTLPSYVYYKPLRSSSQGTDLSHIDSPETDGYDDWEWLWDWNEFADKDGSMTNGVHDMWASEDLSQETSFEPLNVGKKFKRRGYSWELDITGAIEVIRNSDDPTIREYADHYVSYMFDHSRIQIRVGDKDPDKAAVIQPIQRGEDGQLPTFVTAQVPQMMLLPMTYEWPQECVFIGHAYEGFVDWVKSVEHTDWYTDHNDELVTVRYDETDLNGGNNGGGNGDNQGNGDNNGGDNGNGGGNEQPNEKVSPNLRWTNVISIVESCTTVSYDTKSSGSVWYALSNNNLADVTLDTTTKTLTITPYENASGTLIITLYQASDGNDYTDANISMTVTIGKKEETGGNQGGDNNNGSGNEGNELDITKYAKSKGTVPASYFADLQNKITIKIKASSNGSCQPCFYTTEEFSWGTNRKDLTGWEYMSAGTEKTIIIEGKGIVEMIKKYGLGIDGNNPENIEYMIITIE